MRGRAGHRRPVTVGVFGALVTAALAGASGVAPAHAGAAPAGPAGPAAPVLPGVDVAAAESVAPGVAHREFTVNTARGRVEGDLLRVDLANPQVAVDLLYPGAVAARAPVTDMAESAGAVAAVNGDFYDIGSTGAPVGPAVADGQVLKGAVLRGQRYGPRPPPNTAATAVFGVGTDGVGRVARLTTRGEIETPHGTFELDDLNQYGIEQDGIGTFTPVWGDASRKRATCATDSAPTAACATDTAATLVDDGVVTALRDQPAPVAPSRRVRSSSSGVATVRTPSNGWRPAITSTSTTRSRRAPGSRSRWPSVGSRYCAAVSPGPASATAPPRRAPPQGSAPTALPSTSSPWTAASPTARDSRYVSSPA